jgi:hypothetical protein
VTFCLGYLRSLTFDRGYGVEWLSKPRHNKTFSGLALDEKLAAKGVEARCALQVIAYAMGRLSTSYG